MCRENPHEKILKKPYGGGCIHPLPPPPLYVRGLISYNMIISWAYLLNGFQIIFQLRDGATQELSRLSSSVWVEKCPLSL